MPLRRVPSTSCTNAAVVGEAGVVLLLCELSKQSLQVHVADVDVLKNPIVP